MNDMQSTHKSCYHNMCLELKTSIAIKHKFKHMHPSSYQLLRIPIVKDMSSRSIPIVITKQIKQNCILILFLIFGN